MAGLLIPFRRDLKRDFASGDADETLRSKVMQVLMTEGDTPRSSGELPWRTRFGAGLALLRHQRNDAVLAELARVQVREALRMWLPGVKLTSFKVLREDGKLTLRMGMQEGRARTTVEVPT